MDVAFQSQYLKPNALPPEICSPSRLPHLSKCHTSYLVTQYNPRIYLKYYFLDPTTNPLGDSSMPTFKIHVLTFNSIN